jgi:ribosomal protein S18 acetylase RimI-like enzyme
MIRTATLDDAPDAARVTVAAGMFTAEEAGFVPGLFADALAEPRGGEHGLVVDEVDGQVVGVAYWHPVEAADRVVDLTMLAVDPASQGRGLGRALMRHAEDRARSAGQRLMLVMTSGTEQYAGTRRFYAAVGYDEEARVRDYWEDGDDMVLFRLVL